MFKNAIFDIDGTILDTFPGVSRCIRFALKTMDKPIPDDKTLRRFLGPSLMDSFQNITMLTNSEAQEATRLYRQLYKAEGMFECDFFEGYPLLFERLKQNGVLLTVASSKPTPYSKIIFDKLDITKYFESIQGPDLDGIASDKVPFIKAAKVHENAIMVGDRYFDIEAAIKLNIPSIGVTYGFCQEGEFERFKPDYLADNAEQIYDIIMKM